MNQLTQLRELRRFSKANQRLVQRVGLDIGNFLIHIVALARLVCGSSSNRKTVGGGCGTAHAVMAAAHLRV